MNHPFRWALPKWASVSKICIYPLSFRQLGSDHDASLGKHLSGSPAVVRDQITGNLDYLMALSALNGADPLILTRASFSVSGEPGFQSSIIMYIHTHLVKLAHAAQTWQVTVLWLGYQSVSEKCLHFSRATCSDSQVPRWRLLDHS